MQPHLDQSASREPYRAVGDTIFRLTEKDIEEFQEVVHRTSGVWMTPELAAERANALLMLTRVIIGPLLEDSGPGAVRTSSLLPVSPEAR